MTFVQSSLRSAPNLNRIPLAPLRVPISRFRPFSTAFPRSSPASPNPPPRHTRTPSSKSPLKVWPIIAIFCTGTFLFKKIVDQRKEQGNPAKGAIAGHSPSRP